MQPDLAEPASHIRRALSDASEGLIEREVMVELIGLAAVAGEHILLIGPPGTAKSEAVRRVARALQGRYFEYLLGRFTEPMELFGPVDLRRLREGVVVTDTAGMLPEAEIAFLDEIFLGSTAILNTLLGLLNERRFRRGHTDIQCPLRVAVGASNDLPDDVSLSAFADRFLLRVFVDPIPDPRIEELLAGGSPRRWRRGSERASGGRGEEAFFCGVLAAPAPVATRHPRAVRDPGVPATAHGQRALAGGLQVKQRRFRAPGPGKTGLPAGGAEP